METHSLRFSCMRVQFPPPLPTGVNRTIAYTIKKEAETYLGKKRTASREKKLFNVQKDVKIAFEGFGNEYVERHSRISNKSFATDEHRLKNLNKIFGSKYLFEITSVDIEDYKMVRLKDDIKAVMINRDLALVRSMLNSAKEWGR